MTTGALSLFNYLGIAVVAINILLALFVVGQIAVEARKNSKNPH